MATEQVIYQAKADFAALKRNVKELQATIAKLRAEEKAFNADQAKAAADNSAQKAVDKKLKAEQQQLAEISKLHGRAIDENKKFNDAIKKADQKAIADREKLYDQAFGEELKRREKLSKEIIAEHESLDKKELDRVEAFNRKHVKALEEDRNRQLEIAKKTAKDLEEIEKAFTKVFEDQLNERLKVQKEKLKEIEDIDKKHGQALEENKKRLKKLQDDLDKAHGTALGDNQKFDDSKASAEIEKQKNLLKSLADLSKGFNQQFIDDRKNQTRADEEFRKSVEKLPKEFNDIKRALRDMDVDSARAEFERIRGELDKFEESLERVGSAAEKSAQRQAKARQLISRGTPARAAAPVEFTASNQGDGGRGLIGNLNRIGDAAKKIPGKFFDIYQSVLKLSVIGSAILPIVSALGALGASAFAVVGGLAQLSGVVLTLPGIFAAGALSVGVLAVALSGIVKTFKAYSAEQKTSAQDAVAAAQQQKQSARSIADAERSLADARRQSARSAEDNARSVKEAQDDLVKAQKKAALDQIDALERVRDAERELAQSRQDAIRDQEDAALRVSDAELALSRLGIDAARKHQDAIKRVTDADRDLADTQRDLTDAQKDLNDAREQALQDLQDLRAEVEKGKVNEESAIANIAEAQQRYNEILADPGSSAADKAKALADLHQAQSDLNDTEKDNAKNKEDLAKAEKKGVDGADKVVTAREHLLDLERKIADIVVEQTRAREDLTREEQDSVLELADAERELGRARQDQARIAIDSAEKIHDAERDLTDAIRERTESQDASYNGLHDAQQRLSAALRNQSRDAQDSARAIEDAQRGVSRALEDAADSQKKLTETHNQYEDELKKLSPSARKFVEGLIGMKDAFKDIKTATQEAFFAPLVDQLDNIKRVLPFVKDNFQKLAGALGDVAAKFVAFLTTPRMIKFFNTLTDSTARIIEKIGPALIDIFDGLATVIELSLPFIEKMADGFNKGAKNFKKFADSDKGQKKINDSLELGVKRTGQFTKILKNLATAFTSLFQAAGPFIDWTLNGLITATQNFSDFAATQKNPGSGFKKYLEDVKPLLEEIGHLAKQFIDYLFKQSANPKNIQKAIDLLHQLRTELGPAFAHLLDTLRDSNLFSQFISALTKIVKLIDAIVKNNNGFGTFLTIVGGLAKAAKALVDVLPDKVITAFTVFFGTLAALRFVGLGTLSGLKFTGLLKLLNTKGGILAKLSAFLFGKGVKDPELVANTDATVLNTRALGVNTAVQGGGAIPGARQPGGGETTVLPGGAGAEAEAAEKGILARLRTKLNPKNLFKGLKGGKGSIGGILAFLVVSQFIGEFPKIFQDAFNGASTGALIGGIIGLLGGPIGAGLGAAIGAGLFAIFGNSTLRGFFTNLPGLVGNALVNVNIAVATLFANGLQSAWGTVQSLGGQIIGFFVRLPGTIGNALANLNIAISSAFFSGLQSAWGTIQNLGGRILGFFIQLPGRIGNSLANLSIIIASQFFKGLQSAYNTVTQLGGQIVGFFISLPVRISHAIIGIGSSIAGVFARLPGQVSGSLSSFGSQVIGFFNQLPGRIGNALSRIASIISEPFKVPIRFVVNTVLGSGAQAVNHVLDFLRLPPLPVPHVAFATGGVVPGQGNRDTVPAVLTPGEVVIKKRSVDKIGKQRLLHANETGHLPAYGRGGLVGGAVGGITSGVGKVIGGVAGFGGKIFNTVKDFVVEKVRQFAAFGVDKFIDYTLRPLVNNIGNIAAGIPKGIGNLGLDSLVKVISGDYGKDQANVKQTGHANGGLIRGGTSGRDSISSLLTPGEVVIKKRSVDKIGQGTLLRANATGRLPKYAQGGLIGSPIGKTGVYTGGAPNYIYDEFSGVNKPVWQRPSYTSLMPTTSSFSGNSGFNSMLPNRTDNSTINRGLSIENVNVINPRPETAAGSLPRVIRNLTYLNGV